MVVLLVGGGADQPRLKIDRDMLSLLAQAHCVDWAHLVQEIAVDLHLGDLQTVEVEIHHPALQRASVSV